MFAFAFVGPPGWKGVTCPLETHLFLETLQDGVTELGKNEFWKSIGRKSSIRAAKRISDHDATAAMLHSQDGVLGVT